MPLRIGHHDGVLVPRMVLDEDAAAGTEAYFQRLMRHVERVKHLDEGCDGAVLGPPPTGGLGPTDGDRVQVVDLLRRGDSDGEAEVSVRYEAAVAALQMPRVRYCHLDWHGAMDEGGVEPTVEQLWAVVPFAGAPASTGVMARDAQGRLRTTADAVQARVLRFNCADSLDRTNLAAFFEALRALKWLRRALKFSTCTRGHAAAEGRGCGEGDGGWFGSCPSRDDLRRVERDSVRDSSLSPGRELAAPAFEDVVGALGPDLLAAVCGMFVTAGDAVAEIFTGSGAMHTAAIRRLAPELPSAPSNALIALRRRIENTFHDAKRTVQSDLLLGRHSSQEEWERELCRKSLERLHGDESVTDRTF